MSNLLSNMMEALPPNRGLSVSATAVASHQQPVIIVHQPHNHQQQHTRRILMHAFLLCKLTPFDWDGLATRSFCSVMWPLLAPLASPLLVMVSTNYLQ
jgi:hypothetical protein